MTKTLLLFAMLGCLSAFAAPIATTNLLSNPGGEANNLNAWSVGGSSNPRLDNGSFDVNINPHSGTNDFLGGTGPLGSLSQTVSLVGNQGLLAASIDNGNLLAYVSFWEQGLNQGEPSDDAFVSLFFLDAASSNIGTWTSPEIDSHFAVWSNYSVYVPIPVNTRFIQYNMNFLRHAGNDLDAFVDDNVLAVADTVQKPLLNIAATSTNALVYWPALYSDGFLLQQNSNIVTTNWMQTVVAAKLVTGTNQVTFSSPAGNQFFRLYHP